MSVHNRDVTWTPLRPRSPATRVFCSTIFQAYIKETSMLCVTGPLLGEFTGHCWIPLTKGQQHEINVYFPVHGDKTVVISTTLARRYVCNFIWIPIVQIRWYYDRLISTMGFPIRRRYKVTPSLIGCAQTLNQPCILLNHIHSQRLDNHIYIYIVYRHVLSKVAMGQLSRTKQQCQCDLKPKCSFRSLAQIELMTSPELLDHGTSSLLN